MHRQKPGIMKQIGRPCPLCSRALILTGFIPRPRSADGTGFRDCVPEDLKDTGLLQHRLNRKPKGVISIECSSTGCPWMVSFYSIEKALKDAAGMEKGLILTTARQRIQIVQDEGERR